MLPRLSLSARVAALSAAEAARGGAGSWVADRFVDSGPLLRLQAPGATLSRAARYGQPYERSIAPSAIPEAAFRAAVLSYFEHGLAGVAPREAWSWAELHAFNEAVDWRPWQAAVAVAGGALAL